MPLKCTSNTDVRYYAGNLISSWYLGGAVYKIGPQDLQTRGKLNGDPRLQGLPISAHSKVDEKTGEEDDPCEKCNGVGFYGRVAMIEAIVVTDPIRKLIATGAPPDQIKALARAEGCQTFHKDGLRLVAEGKTSLEELQRVFKT